jgi:hypothetical protein
MSDKKDPRASANINLEKTYELEPETVEDFDKLEKGQVLELIKSYSSEDQRKLQEKGKN